MAIDRWLNDIEVVAVGDGDILQLRCTKCGAYLHHIEAGDTMASLLETVGWHVCGKESVTITRLED